MKKFLAFILILVISTAAFSQTIKRGETILKDGVTVVPSEGPLVPFDYGGKIGFFYHLRSDYICIIPPTFDDVYGDNYSNNGGLAIVGKYNEKGVMKYGIVNTMLTGDPYMVPCIYDRIDRVEKGKTTAYLNGEKFPINAPKKMESTCSRAYAVHIAIEYFSRVPNPDEEMLRILSELKAYAKKF